MSLLVIILIALLLTGSVGTLPQWGHAYGNGYASGGMGLVVLILIILLLTGRI